MPLNQTSGNVTTDAYGGGVAAVPTYIEDVFSTYLYTGNGSTQTITNGIDLSTKGGLVWTKCRTTSFDHAFFDTSRGAGKFIKSNSTAASVTDADTLTGFNANGFSLGSDGNYGVCNLTGNYASWTFRKQPKFFDVVTWTGNGSARTIAHSLGSVPGCIIVKRTDTTSDWYVYHRGLTTPATNDIYLNSFLPANSGVTTWNSTDPTSTVFSVDATVNASGGTYVAYLYAHNAGGFGLTGADNVITCGSYTGNGATQDINLGFEPQYIILKNTEQNYNWTVVDTMRGMNNTSSSWVYANTSASEASNTPSYLIPTATGFTVNTSTPTYNASTRKYIYIAIRRGPMKVPTDATKVFLPYTYTGNAASNRVITPPLNSPADLMFGRGRTNGNNTGWYDRLRGKGASLTSNTTASESFNASNPEGTLGQNNFVVDDTYGFLNNNGVAYAMYLASRAPSFFDEVCYTGNSTPTAYMHNLGAVPELMIVKRRSGSEAGGIAGYWVVYAAASGNANALFLNTNDGNNGASVWNSTTPTSTTFTVNDNYVNYSGDKYVAYLFATCAGVSKVGSYTGNGGTQAIACGFAGGARFVLIKRTDSTGNWYVYDTARGMSTLTDPYLLLNSTAAETATLGSVTTTTGGFTVNASILAAINTNAASYIFLAIA